MNVKQTLLEKFKDGSFALLTDDAIAKKLHLKGKAAAGLEEMLLSLCREGELLCDLRGRFGTAQQFGAMRGTISAAAVRSYTVSSPSAAKPSHERSPGFSV